MSTSRRAHSRSLIRDAKGRYRESPLVTERHRKVLRQLLTVLEELIDETEGKEDMKERPKSVTQESDDRDPAGESGWGAMDEPVTCQTRTSSRPAPEKETVLKKADNQSSNVIQRYKKSLDEFTQLSNQICGSLASLGGGGRAAKALKEMKESFTKIYEEYLESLSSGSDSEWKDLDIPGCVTLLRNAQTGLDEVTNSFKELEISNDSFKNELIVFRSNLFEAAIILKAEYGQFKDIELAGNYIEREVLDPLTTAFGTFSAKLRDGVDKEVAMIRKAQNFSGQRYLNLTTVATFLSSVTATTLQITLGNQQSVQSVLSIIMNTMWFTSLVFSTASAVYSLLIMTWRQSPVRQFDNDSSHIPSWFLAFLRNGPVFTLIAAVIAFSVGLCILAFQTAIQQGLIATAIVPIVFAGGHASFLLLVSGWFLWEQWKAKHPAFWEITKSNTPLLLLDRIKKNKDNVLKNIKESITQFYLSIPSLRDRTRVSSPGSDVQIDIEKDADLLSREHNTSVAEMVHPSSDPDELGNELQDVQDVPNPELLRASHLIEVTPSYSIEPDARGDEESVENDIEHPVFQPNLQFSPSGEFLAFARGHRITIYDATQVDSYFSIVQSIEMDDETPAKLITWSERDHLLVQAERSIKIWKIDSSSGKDSTDATKEPWGSITFDIEPSAIHWTSDVSGDEVEDMIIVVHHDLVSIYDSHCKNIKSINFSAYELYITDAVSLGSSRLLCLTRSKEGGYGYRYNFRLDAFVNSRLHKIVVFNFETGNLEKTCDIYSDDHTLILSKKKDKAFLHGDKNTTTLVKIGDDKLQAIDFWNEIPYQQELQIPGGAIGFYGNDDELIYGVSGYEIVILRPSTGEDSFSYNALHIITSPTLKSEIAPISFSFRPDTVPYKLAFGLPDGRIKVWSIQSNTFFKSGSPGVDAITIHDRKGRDKDPRVTTGKCFTITSPRESEDDQQELE